MLQRLAHKKIFEKDQRKKHEQYPLPGREEGDGGGEGRGRLPFGPKMSKLYLNPLNAELSPICHLLVLLGAHHILHISRIRVKGHFNSLNAELNPICHLLALLEARHILHVSRIRVNIVIF